MSDLAIPSRRKALKLLSAAPLLPLGSMATASLLAGCSNVGRTAPGAAGYAATSFTSMAAPTDAVAMATTTVGSVMNVHFSDDTVQRYKLAYQPFFLTGTEVPKQGGGTIVAGGYYDIHNEPIMDTSGATPRQFFSDSPDGSSLLALPNPAIPGIKGKAVFAVVQFEYTSSDAAGEDIYGQLPSPIAVLTLDQDQATGKLTLVQYHNVDTSGVHGLWITCGASLSPWGTHLSSEEYEPNVPFLGAPAGNRNNTTPHFNQFSLNTFKAAYGAPGGANPYHYGHVPEVTVHPDGSGSIKKHYCLGRISHELIQVMPDERTVLMGDDYTNGGLFMFVADRKRDLSAGTLYVARLTSSLTLDTASAGATLDWIKLGHATSDEIEALIDSGIRLDDFMHVTDTDMRADPGYTKIFADKNANWVKLVDPADARLVKAAAFLETHRYANLKGASMGFTKLEGTTVNIKDKIAYSALQNIQDSMIAGHAANRPETNIALPKALLSGGVFAHDLTGGQRDTDGAPIDSEWVPTRTRALLLGEDIATDALGNKSNPDRIGNPDNLKFSEKMRTLFIGEDSSRHTNNFLWAYHIDTRKLSRLMSLPAGAESTGLHAVDEINGWTYIMSNFQHPGDGTAKAAITDKRLRTDVVNAIDRNYGNKYQAAVGYLTADPLQPKLS